MGALVLGPIIKALAHSAKATHTRFRSYCQCARACGASACLAPLRHPHHLTTHFGSSGSHVHRIRVGELRGERRPKGRGRALGEGFDLGVRRKGGVVARQLPRSSEWHCERQETAQWMRSRRCEGMRMREEGHARPLLPAGRRRAARRAAGLWRRRARLHRVRRRVPRAGGRRARAAARRAARGAPPMHQRVADAGAAAVGTRRRAALLSPTTLLTPEVL